MSITIATWNINSIRIRLPLLEQLIALENPDIICLQEIKTEEKTFPFEAVKQLGYAHTYVHGQKGYHGVATLSKTPLTHLESLSLLPDDGARHISLGLPDGTELHNFYVPAGGDIPDRMLNPYYGFKLDYVDAMNRWFCSNKKSADKLILVGDLNIAPLEHDVWSHKQLLNVVSHTPDEVSRLNQFYKDFGWRDSVRHFTPDTEKLYSWWSYRNQDWKKSNRGRRLDHVWITEPLLPRLKKCTTLVEARDWEKPSDHVPIIITLK
jgi:exodeoxyribonuclease-3